MKSRTSFCKSALVKKDITRFAPIWVLYIIFTLLALLSTLNGNVNNNVLSVATMIRIFSIVNLVYGFLIAQLLFGDLFQSRLCNALHAMPISRTHQFWSHVTAGMLFSLLPNVAATIAMMFRLGHLWYVALLWLLGVSLSYVYFFGLAVLCMMLTGNRFACTAVYAIINFFAYVVWWFLYSVFQPLMPGVVIGGGSFSLFCPVVLMMESFELFDYKYEYVIDGPTGIVDQPSLLTGIVLKNDWITFAIFGLVGVGMLILALALYRRRALEKAGDFLAVKALEPVFLVLYTLCAGAFCALCAIEDELLPVFLAVGILIGYFTGRMLLERTVRVLHKRAFVGLEALALVLAVALGLTKLDVFGVVRYVPEAENVENVYFETYMSGNSVQVTFVAAEDLEQVEALHQTILAHLEDDDSKYYTSLTLRYTLKNGRTVSRSYRNYSAAVQAEAKKLCQRPQIILGFNDPAEAAEQLEEVALYRAFSNQKGYVHNTHNIQGVLEALLQDCVEGNITASVFDEKYSEEYLYIMQYDLSAHYLYIGKEAVHTVAWLEHYFAVQEGLICAPADGYEEVYLSATAKREIIQLLRDAKWTDGMTNCKVDFDFNNLGQKLEYHSECGTFRDVENNRCYTVSDSQRLQINGYLGAA